jgi:lipid-binding SYLF domain-containing protein
MCQSIQKKRIKLSAVIVALCLSFASMAPAQSKNAKKLADATKNAQEASDTFTEIMNVPDKGIPRDLLDKAEAIGVFEVVKAGFIVGGRSGHGVISRRVKGGWGAPAFYNLNGGSFGLANWRRQA